MKTDNNVKLYNILLPLWLLVFWPSWLWLILIPANYLIDRIVLRWSLGDIPDKGLFCRKHNWKICLAGFLSDFIGAAIMLGAVLAFSGSEGYLEEALSAVMFNPFTNVLGFILVALSVGVAGACIYFLDRRILSKAGLDIEQAKKSALRLALITAPYVFFFPSSIIYDSGNWI